MGGGDWFLCVWVDRELSWVGHIHKVTVKVRQLFGIMGRASGVLDGGLLLSLYNGMVLPHLQYCLMVWGDFEVGCNKTRGEALLRLFLPRWGNLIGFLTHRSSMMFNFLSYLFVIYLFLFYLFVFYLLIVFPYS